MRIWSIHPQYLDAKGLVALWREALLAKHVLENKTKGYKHHPQLLRFKAAENSIAAINQYLVTVHEEAVKRGYHFEKNKIEFCYNPVSINVTSGQIEYEKKHLLQKLKIRDIYRYIEIATKKTIVPHPIFKVKEGEGEVEEWEVTK